MSMAPVSPMDPSTEVTDLFSSVTIGAVLGLIFYFIFGIVGGPGISQFELGLPQLVLIGGGLGLVFYLFGLVQR